MNSISFKNWVEEFAAISDPKTIVASPNVDRPFEEQQKASIQNAFNSITCSFSNLDAFIHSIDTFIKNTKKVVQADVLDHDFNEKISKVINFLKSKAENENMPLVLGSEIKKLDKLALELELKSWLVDPNITGNKEIAVQRILKAFESNQQQLDLSSLALTELPECLYQLKYLKELNVEDNLLTSLPKSIEKLTKLKTLSLSGNQLTSLPDSIRFLQKLTELNLEKNAFSVFPLPILELTNLKRLFLDDNQLEIIPAGIGELVNLTHLHLSQNNLVGIPDSIGLLTRLLSLNLSGNELTSIPGSIGQLTNLIVLELSDNQLTAIPEHIKDLKNLNALHLEFNSLQSLPVSLGHLTNLIVLHFYENPDLTYLPLSLSEIPEIVHMDIDGTEITEELRDVFLKQCETLKKLGSSEVLFPRLNKWQIVGDQQDLDFSFLHSFDLEEIGQINEWLKRLEFTEDLNSCIERQEALASLTCKILHYTSENNEFKKIFMDQVRLNNEDCEDKSAMSLNELYIAWKISTLPPNATLAYKLEVMAGVSRTMALRAFLAQSIRDYKKLHNLTLDEDVEIFLYYESELKDSLGLDSAIETMNYAEVGKRDWIDETVLTANVEKHFLDHLIQLDVFKSILAKDKEFQTEWSPTEDQFYNKLYDLSIKLGELEASLKTLQKRLATTSHEKELEDETFEDNHRSLENEIETVTNQTLICKTEIGDLNAQQQAEKDKLAKAWYKTHSVQTS